MVVKEGTNMGNWLIGALHVLVLGRRDERGLSQSTENAVLLAGAIAIAGVVITLVGAYVQAHMPK